jgi:hypothetical protein
MLEAFLSAMKNPDWEPAFEQYREHLVKLNAICEQHTNAPESYIEGSLFYPAPHETANALGPVPDPRTLTKRRNYAAFAMTGSSLLEIGFNGGHSALLALSINPGLRYTGIDLGSHHYTAPCFAFLRELFGSRIELIIGDSREVLPALRHVRGQEYDIFHIDGGHGFACGQADLCNMMAFCEDGDVILFDDTNFDQLLLEELCDFYAMKGLVTRIVTGRLWQGNQHVLLRVNKRHRA